MESSTLGASSDTAASLAGNSLSDSAGSTYQLFVNGDYSTASQILLWHVLPPAFGVLAVLIVTYMVSSLVSRLLATVLCNRVDQTLGKFTGRFTFYALMILSCLGILQTVGAPVTGLAAVLAAAGFAIGLAFQGTLSNFAAGILLMVFRPFRVGDVVNVATVTGKVNEIDLFTTTLDTPDNRRLIIPNSAIAGTTIENLTYHKHRRVDVTVGISYAADLDRSRTVLQNCISLHEDKLISGDGRGAQVLLTALNSSSVDWTVRFWTAAENFHAVKELLTVEIKRQLDLAGLEIPFPQMHLHVSRRVDDAFVDTPSTEAEPAPIPKMLTLPASNNGRVRPRARG